jgi:hypothetical protein
MASCIVLPRTISACGSLQTLYLYKLAASWLSFCTLCLLFSIAYSLFGQKQGGGYTLQNRSFRISNIQTLFPRPVCNSVNGRPVRNLLRASDSLWQSFLLGLCFQNDTNRSCRNSLVFTSIQNTGGVGPALFALCTQGLSGRRGRMQSALAPCPPLRCQSICPQIPAVTCLLAARKARCSQPRGSTNSMAPFLLSRM